MREALRTGLLTIQQRLDLSTGIAPPGHDACKWSACGCRRWPSYAQYLATYALVRDDLLTHTPRDQAVWAESLWQAVVREPQTDVEVLGARLWRRRVARRARRAADWSAYTHRVDQYARRVLGDPSAGAGIVAGPAVRAACQRHLTDRGRADQDPTWYQFDPVRADHVLAFIEQLLRLPDLLDDAGRPRHFRLEPWQAFIVGSLFGWVRMDGARRYREAYIEVGKGNGKTPLCAAIGLYGLLMDGEHAAEIYAAAADQIQAQVLFRDAVRIVRASPDLDPELGVLTCSGDQHVWQLLHEPSLSFYRTFSRDSGAKSGPRPHMALLDELHEHGTPQISLKIRAGAKRRVQPLFVEITNSGVDRASLCWQHHEHSCRVVEGTVEDDQWFAFVASLDPQDDPLQDPACWVKANPNLGVSVPREYLERQVALAQHLPGETNTVLRLNFCVWTQAERRYFDMSRWHACTEVVSDQELVGRWSVAGLDLGQSDDLSAFARIWPLEDGRIAVRMRYWLPEAALAKYPDRPYDAWLRSGLLTVTDGEVSDLDRIEQEVLEACRASGVRELGYDKRFAQQMALHWVGAGLTVTDVAQGFALNEAIQRLAALVVEGRLCHGGDPILAWMAANTVVREGRSGERRLDKERSVDKIDGIVALAIAVQIWLRQPPTDRSVYDERGVITV